MLETVLFFFFPVRIMNALVMASLSETDSVPSRISLTENVLRADVAQVELRRLSWRGLCCGFDKKSCPRKVWLLWQLKEQLLLFFPPPFPPSLLSFFFSFLVPSAILDLKL